MRDLCRWFVGVLLAVWAASAPAAAFDDCESAEFVALIAADLPEQGLPPFECVEIQSETLPTNGQPVAIRLLRDSRTDPQQVQDYGQQALTTVEGALAKYATLAPFKFGDISVVLMNPAWPWPPRELGITWYASADGECVIRVFSGNIENSQSADDRLTLFSNTMAHELFHCVQLWNYREQTHLAADGALWWIESAAELFAHLVYPDPPRLQRLGKRYNDQIQVKPQTQVAYPGVVFMAWLWNRGPERVLKLMTSMPASEKGEAAQQAALLENVGAEELQEFAHDWADGTITAPDGAQFPRPETGVPLLVDKDSELSLSGPPLALQLDAVDITRGQYAAIEFDGGGILARQRDAGGGAWAEMPMSVGPEDCADTLHLLLVRMPANESQAGERIQFQLTQPCEECVVSEVRDACLAGQWLMDNDTLMTLLRSWNQEDTRFTAIGGKIVLVLDANGQAQLVAEGVDIQAVVETPDAPKGQIKVAINGIDTGSWAAEGGKLNYCAAGTTLDFTADIEMEGGAQSKATSEGILSNSTFDYACGDDLDMQYAGPLDLGERAPRWHFTRIK